MLLCYFVAQGCKKVNSSKNGRFRYEMIGKTQPEMKLLEVATFIYLFSLKAGSSIPSATKILIFEHSIAGFCVMF